MRSTLGSHLKTSLAARGGLMTTAELWSETDGGARYFTLPTFPLGCK